MADGDNGNDWSASRFSLEQRAEIERIHRTVHLFRGPFADDRRELRRWFKDHQGDVDVARDVIMGRVERYDWFD